MAEEDRPRRFAIIGSRGYPSTYGGFETFVRRFAPFLARRGHRVTVYARAGWHRSEIRHHGGVEVIATRGVDSKSLSTLTHGATAVLDARSRHIDAALVLNVANGFYLPLLSSVPTVVNVDGLEWQRRKWNGVGRVVFRAGAHMAARHASVIVCDSRAIKEYWDSTYGINSQYIPYGADVLDDSRTDEITELGLCPGEYILTVARLVPENNVDLLLDAVEKLPTSIPLVVVGSANYRSPLSERLHVMARKRSNVFALGHVDNQTLLAQLWAHAGVYWHGHSVGGTNPALLQAMGAGSPVLAFRSVFNREVLGSENHLVGADAGLLAKRLLAVLQSDNLQQQLRSHGRQIVERDYRWDAVCDSYLRLLLKCVGS